MKNLTKLGLITGCVLFINSCKDQTSYNPSNTPVSEKSQLEDEELDILIDASLEKLGIIKQDLLAEKPDIDPEKVAVGAKLFHDVKLGQGFKHDQGKGFISCATCHDDSKSGYSTNKIGLGDGSFSPNFGHPRSVFSDYKFDEVDKQNVTTPTYINCEFTSDYFVFNKETGKLVASGDTASLNNGAGGGFDDINKDVDWMPLAKAGKPWALFNYVFEDELYSFDGGEPKKLDGMQGQAIFGQGVHRMSSTSFSFDEGGKQDRIDATDRYMKYVKSEYGDVIRKLYGKDFVNDLGVGLLITDFEKSKVTTEDGFNKYLAGDLKALTINQKKGFFGFIKHSCIQCHNGKALGGGFYNSPHPIKTDHNGETLGGRFGVTGKESDKGLVRTPPLDVIRDKVALGWGGGYKDVEDIVKQTIPDISEEDLNAIVDFLENAVYEKIDLTK